MTPPASTAPCVIELTANRAQMNPAHALNPQIGRLLIASEGRGDRPQRNPEVRDALRQVHVQPVRDVARRRLQDDLVVVRALELFDDVVVGVWAVRHPAVDLAAGWTL